VTPDRKKLYVATYTSDAISVIDTATNTSRPTST
jgi:YVTN family beta-propeller protein